MSQFYVSDENILWRCRESVANRKPITVCGITLDNKIRVFTGAVQAVEEDLTRDPGKRWRVTIQD